MPWVEHFRFVKPWPGHLLYRNGAIELGIVEVPGEFTPWRFCVTKLNQARTAVDLCYARSRLELDRCLHSDGFMPSEKTDSPAFKIMQRLEHEGYAQRARIKIHAKTGARC